ncbi:hypothetical protein [Georgenia thermotolerans]|uniref:Alternate-type signal peptide domain-containing protein n=1 Tax=Georgenia thermotolerans TaxID=527326 RepID=A0A7J5UP54_9MICO|nr:hypothetical protein [Georgenia thermotolerans]KAE8764182.1 hypothetical protein GB883_10405 [Georgenia thermotolerans]
MRANALRGLAAVALAVVLLSSGLSSTALWSAQALAPSAQVTTGRLGLVQHDMTITLTRGGAVPIDVTATLDAQALRPGDVLTYTVPATLVLEGTSLQAELRVDAGELAGSTPAPLGDIVRQNTTVTIVSSGQNMGAKDPLHVTSEWNGQVVKAVVTVTIPASAGAGDEGKRLNGQALQQGTIRWSLTQK